MILSEGACAGPRKKIGQPGFQYRFKTNLLIFLKKIYYSAFSSRSHDI
jgi:hypothetical protein